MNKKQLIVFLALLIVTPVFAEDSHPIDVFLDECQEQNTSTAGMVDCLEQACKKWEVEIEKYYNLLMDILKEESKERLRQSQLAWLKFRDLESEFISEGYFLDIGSYIRPTKRSNQLTIIRNRALQLKIYYNTVNN